MLKTFALTITFQAYQLINFLDTTFLLMHNSCHLQYVQQGLGANGFNHLAAFHNAWKYWQGKS